MKKNYMAVAFAAALTTALLTAGCAPKAQATTTAAETTAEETAAPAPTEEAETEPETAPAVYGDTASVTLGEYKNLKAERVMAEVTDEEVQSQIDQVLKAHPNYTEVDRAAETGDTVNINFEGKIDGANTYRNVFGEDEHSKNAAEAAQNPKNAAEPRKAEPTAGGQKAEENEHIPPETGNKEPEVSTEKIAPAQKEAADIGKSNEKTAPETAENTPAEEPEQVEIDEILPAPVEPDPMRDLKDRFTAEINSLKIMLECENFSGMAQTIERLEHLRVKMAGMAALK